MKSSFLECINGINERACFPSSWIVRKHVLEENLCSNEYALTTVISCSISWKLDVGKQFYGYVLKYGLVFHLLSLLADIWIEYSKASLLFVNETDGRRTKAEAL
ncbi:hypothetical protein LguiB_012607 [Lonicera macranthoides]